MEARIKYEFSAKMWKHDSPDGWYFVSLPKTISKEIRENLKWQEEGWGRMKTIAEIQDVSWQTAIWFDTKLKTYILPIKAKIRSKLNLQIAANFQIKLWL